jgi:hypothetical protein
VTVWGIAWTCCFLVGAGALTQRQHRRLGLVALVVGAAGMLLT